MSPRHLRLSITPSQHTTLRRAAHASRKTLNAFVIDSAMQAAEESLIDQRMFEVDEHQSRALLDLLDRPARDNAGLEDLFARRAPWGD